ncbi:efflux RND transporter periplasmic adaptor subunit [Sphingomonas sp. S-NIH.Pt15_0812]|jgi:RND family efflux transporter MFP subunit|uniref:efflux RND transporter periplasmic adaptor subunit n=1 Tax=Sphingomonas sp. S-NIH.Pt15_0812 TaxID=1920129 RepID=UPI000F7DE3A9|nr:efflux RND transporter periplasmic adaptor subunit [Sphingomonas sp. S-NIH.Pt15_0812]RSU53146.1 efflux RND transporter periplasmic adaptor subunit [Sphingomonas sp. S-NIH.Pt15_0812]
MNYETGTIAQERLAGPDVTQGRKRRRWVIAIVVVLLVAVAAWAVFGRGHKAATAKPVEQLPTVSVIAPGRSTVDRLIQATGTLAARREMPVGVAGEGGMITRVLVEPGAWVKAGQVLATVDRSVQTQTAAALGAQVNVAQADLVLAQAELDRAKALVDRGFISKADLQRRTATRDAAAARVKVAGASYAESRARNGRLDIRAPADGLVLTRQAEPGQIVGAGSGVLFRMAQGGQMEMRAQLSEADLIGLSPGARAIVTPVGSSRRFNGEVWQVSPVIDPQTRQGVARVLLRYDPALRPGGFASAQIVSGVSYQPLLPDSALQSDDRGAYVYIVDAQDKVQRRDVKLGQVSDAGVAITSGLNGTERVVRSAGGFLAPGQKIKPVLQKA